MMSTWHAILLSIVEGFTEYLPISSTGHIILTSAFLGIESDTFVKNFTVIVQFGAIMSVLIVYWRRFLQSFDFYKKLIVGFLPAAVIGLLVKNHIDAVLGNVEVVAWALIIGGIVLVFIDRYVEKKAQSQAPVQDVSFRHSMVIGLIQCFAFIPGVSRSGASIVGGLLLGVDRKTAAEFSFFLAVPTLAGATLLKLIKIAPTITPDQIQILILGNIVSLVVGWLSIKAFITYLTKFGFKHFGWYRIGLGLFLLILIYSGSNLKMV